MVERFNILAENVNFNFEAWFNDRIHDDRSWGVDESDWRFEYRYTRTLVIAGRRLHLPLHLLNRRHPDVMVSLYAEPSFLCGWAIAKIRGVKTGFRVVNTFDSWIRRAPWKEAMKRWLFKRVDFIVTEGRDGREYAQRYGAQREHIYFARHGIDIPHYRNACNMNGPERSLLRKELGAVGITFLYVGRLVNLKGLNYLLDAFKEVQSQSELVVSLVLVGDGTDETYLKHRCKIEKILNVIFVGFCPKKNLPRMYAIADAFVFPTLGDPYGLVVDEAMACSLPIISTSAAGEICDRVEDEINGFIVPPQSSRALTEAMLKLVHDPILRKRMGSVSAKKIVGHTPEKWVEDFEQIVLHMIEST
jgi:glycosyltransferase involved in cell wall biosynthesis